jgi:basic membrane lipoprotein Med (substrate-binding protein (PBP1-ABC) superfamily)
MAYIESWFDPPKGKQSALAQIAAGADFIYAERFGPFETAKEKGKLAFGHFVDQNSLAQDIVVSSTIARWDRGWRRLPYPVRRPGLFAGRYI